MHAAFPFGVADKLKCQLRLREMQFKRELVFGHFPASDKTFSATQTPIIDSEDLRFGFWASNGDVEITTRAIAMVMT